MMVVMMTMMMLMMVVVVVAVCGFEVEPGREAWRGVHTHRNLN